jgi:hypothetical protein
MILPFYQNLASLSGFAALSEREHRELADALLENNFP